MNTVCSKMLSKCFVLSFALVLTEVVPFVMSEECTTKNISCPDIKDKNGHYRFSWETPSAAEEIEINQNGKSLVRGKFDSLTCSPDVVGCDKNSITVQTCEKMDVKFIKKQGRKVSESCLIFNIIEEPKDVDSSPSWGTIVGVVAPFMIVGACVAGCYWKKKRKIKGTSVTQGRRQDQRCAEEENRLNSEQQEKLDGKLDGKGDSSGSNGQVMDVSIDMGDMNAANDDNKGVPEVNGAVPREGQRGNKWHDPGGGKADTGQQGTHCCLNGWTLGGQSSGNDMDKEQHPPRSHGSARPVSDETAGEEGQALVDGLDPSSDHTALPGIQREELAMKWKK